MLDQHWPVHWLQLKVLVGKAHRAKRVTFGICGKTHRVMRVSPPPLVMLVMNDLIVDDATQSCEEGRRCLNTACPLNKTTPASMAAAMGLKRRPAWLTEIKPVAVDADLQAHIDQLCDAHPDCSVFSVID